MKPVIDLKYMLGDNPSKNYVLNLLATHIQAINPMRSLDAGCGALRNLWMFPNKYVGIGLSRADYRLGLKQKPNRLTTQKYGMPDVYLMRLERDFSFLGTFDLVVCTFCMTHPRFVGDHHDLVRRLSSRVRKDGALILDGWIEKLDGFLGELQADYEKVDVVYWGLEEYNRRFDDLATLWNPSSQEEFEMIQRRLHKRSAAEMNAPNTPELYKRFYLCAVGKKTPPDAAGTPPETINDNGLYIVKEDIPNLDID